jgi:hypothetical protein
MKTNDKIWLGIAFTAALLVLNSNPRCNRGCRTVAEHLLEHGIEDIFISLLG